MIYNSWTVQPNILLRLSSVHARISWVSIEIYYHDNFVFGHFFMILTSIFAHFCVLCTYLVGKQQEAYGESNHGMLFICWHMLRS